MPRGWGIYARRVRCGRGRITCPRGRGALKPYGDTLELAALHLEDLRAIRGLRGRGIPVVAVLVSGRPLVVDEELAASAGFVVAWLSGSEGGGVADVLFGDFDFVGRLPMGWPGGVVGGGGGGDGPGVGGAEVLFPVGYGLRMG